MRGKGTAGEYLAFLSVKYDVEPNRLFDALATALRDGDSTCGSLSIIRRSRIRGNPIFLITKEHKVVAQFPIPDDFFLRKTNPIADSRNTDVIRRYLTRRANGKPRTLHVSDLRTGMKQINLRAKVLEIPEPKLVFTRYGNYVAVTNALISDETGDIRLCLWNDQINSISEGDTIQVKNARTSIFRGEQQLRIGKNGELSVIGEQEIPSLPVASNELSQHVF